MKVRTKEKINSRLKDFFGHIWGYVVWFLILALAISVVRNVKKAFSIRNEIGLEQAKVNKIKEENSRLEAEITQAQSDVYIEKQVRDKLGLVKEGEAIVVLPDEDVLRALAPQIREDSDTLPDPVWRKWLKLFL
jgi:cell division protein FtsB/cell division protein DivIC